MTPILHVDGLSKTFVRGDEVVRALDDVSFSVDTPQIVALSGPSGSGKTTLLNLLARFDIPEAGEIHIGGTAFSAIKERQMDRFRNDAMGFVFQQFNLLKVLTARENVELTLLPQKLRASVRRQRAQEMLDAVGLADRMHHTPEQLSGGQQQRVAIARALVGRPQIVIADEPTGNLDGRTAADILALIGRLNRELQTTFVIATHDQRVVALSDQVITLTDGKHIK